MIVACIITYNDYPLIKSCIESVVNKVDRIIAVDGKYADFSGDLWDSTDGTLEYLCSIDKADVISTINYSELDKRNAYLNELNEGDICLNLDADEVLIGDIPKLHTDIGLIDIHDAYSKQVQTRASRLFRYKKGLEYKNVHYTLYYKDRIVNTIKKILHPDFSFEKFKDPYILHNWNLRPETRKYYKEIYYKQLNKKESGFIK